MDPTLVTGLALLVGYYLVLFLVLGVAVNVLAGVASRAWQRAKASLALQVRDELHGSPPSAPASRVCTRDSRSPHA